MHPGRLGAVLPLAVCLSQQAGMGLYASNWGERGAPALEGTTGSPVRLFTVAYGQGADIGVLRPMAEATNAAADHAGDPTPSRWYSPRWRSNF